MEAGGTWLSVEPSCRIQTDPRWAWEAQQTLRRAAVWSTPQTEPPRWSNLKNVGK